MNSKNDVKQLSIIEYGALTEQVGGVETYIYNQIQHIDDVRYDFCVPNEKYQLAFEKELAMRGCVFHRTYRRWKNSPIGHIIDLYNFFKSNKYDIAVANYLDLQNIWFLIIAKCFGIKTVAHAHAADANRSFVFMILNYINRWLGTIFIDCLFACSKNAGLWMFGERLWSIKKHYIIHNGIEIDKFLYDDSIRRKIRKKYQIDDNTLVVGNVGRLTNGKNHIFMLDVFAEICKSHSAIMVLVGDGDLRKTIENYVRKLKLDNKVFLLGMQKNVNELLQMMDVFFFPSVHEGLPVSLIEAQVSSLPCIVSENITREVEITSLCDFVSLDEPIQIWKEHIVDKFRYRRKRFGVELNNSGYSIVQESKKVKELYYEIARRN